MPKYNLKPIKGKKLFSGLFASGKRFYDSDAMAVARFGSVITGNCPQSAEDGETWQQDIYYAVSVRKKTAKKSVVRNRIKRLLRESLRQVTAEFESQGRAVPFTSIMIFWRNAPVHPKLIGLQDVLPSVRKVFHKACVYKPNKVLINKQEAETNEKDNNPADKGI